MYRFCSLIFAALLAGACGGNVPEDKVEKSTEIAQLDASDDTTGQVPDVVPGVSLDLANARATVISDINYELVFHVPREETAAINADQRLTFQLKSLTSDLQLDFREDGERIKALSVNDEVQEIIHRDEHLVLVKEALRIGENKVEIAFIAGDTSLNRNPDYLYTLFVPDRARTAFPVFDQPNLKATYDLALDLPAEWVALGNGLLLSSEAAGEGRRVHKFARSDRLSSYLFSFVAGEFETVARTIDGREMTMLHRETDADKVARNVDAIFQAHADALAWLEDYTGVDYPFQKFDFALIPTFQYGGMEHVGAIQYRASTLFLDEDPSDPQRLNRANLIAHETAHMWFGDLVTMNWFNDVWTKEVFANFMAAKIVNPSFPKIDHDLNFLLRSYPAAYAVDRTAGANPIRQALPNLNEAGTLYGGIIYNKAPIMMNQLEHLLGEEPFRDGIREYVTTYAGGNATWPDLINILDKRTEVDLTSWSEVWVNTPGRPHYSFSPDGRRLKQADPQGKGRFWGQSFSGLMRADKGLIPLSHSVLTGTSGEDQAFDLRQDVLVNADGAGYGLFPVNLELTKQLWHDLPDLQRGAQLINLYEQMLEGNEAVSPADYLDFLHARLDEPNQLLLNTMLSQLRRIYWSFLPQSERREAAITLERSLWSFIADQRLPPSQRKIYLRTLQDITLDSGSHTRLRRILDGEEFIEGISMSSRERSDLAALLAIKIPEKADDILGRHIAWLQNPDERRRLRFLMPALSASEADRDAFFTSLADVENRATESWVVEALGYVHHPERISSSERYIEKSLELLEEIQVTGDIFFPARWVGQTLSNHTSDAALGSVERFLAARPDYNYQLRLKILQADDLLRRANAASKR